MARLTRGRIVTRGPTAVPRAALEPSPTAVRRIAREVMEARELAARTLADAQKAAAAIIEEARAKAATAVETASREAAQAEQAKLAARFLALQAREQRSAEVELDRSVELARLLAERLIGEALVIDASTIAKLARQALAEARGARKVRIEVHPDDVLALEQSLSVLSNAHVASISGDATLHRGCLRLHTELGTIDANLGSQLERLAAALRDALR